MSTCIDAFKNLYVEERQTEIYIAPCCLSKTTKLESNLDFVKNSELASIRESWTNQKFPHACQNCNQSEKDNNTSRRIGSNQWYQDHGFFDNTVELIRLDYWTGDLCNLACAICGPNNSSVWKEELNLSTDQKKVVVNKFWKNLNLSKLKFVHFNGGEPLLSKEHLIFLDSIQNKSEVHLNYNTNGTVLPTEHLLNLWQQFKLVQLDFSIDDIGTRFEYQRYPAKWEKIVSNLQWFIDNAHSNCIFAVNTTVSILNQDNIDNLNFWLQKNFNTNRFTDPIEHRKQQCFGILSTHNKDLIKITKYLDSLDYRRGTSWKNTFPELMEYLKS